MKTKWDNCQNYTKCHCCHNPCCQYNDFLTRLHLVLSNGATITLADGSSYGSEFIKLVDDRMTDIFYWLHRLGVIRISDTSIVVFDYCKSSIRLVCVINNLSKNYVRGFVETYECENPEYIFPVIDNPEENDKSKMEAIENAVSRALLSCLIRNTSCIGFDTNGDLRVLEQFVYEIGEVWRGFPIYVAKYAQSYHINFFKNDKHFAVVEIYANGDSEYDVRSPLVISDAFSLHCKCPKRLFLNWHGYGNIREILARSYPAILHALKECLHLKEERI